jgi:hypothetical protein
MLNAPKRTLVVLIWILALSMLMTMWTACTSVWGGQEQENISLDELRHRFENQEVSRVVIRDGETHVVLNDGSIMLLNDGLDESLVEALLSDEDPSATQQLQILVVEYWKYENSIITSAVVALGSFLAGFVISQSRKRKHSFEHE